MRLLVIVATIFFVGLFSLIVIGILNRPTLKPISINSGKGGFNKICQREKVSCNTDSDCGKMCTEAQEGEEIVCKPIPDIPTLTKTQQHLLGAKDTTAPSKYCVPAKATMNCSVSTGGIPIFTGWSGADHMEFECMCSYPIWASSRICDPNSGTCQGSCLLNPGVCEGGTFRWDLTKKAEEPIAGLCECAKGDVLIIDNAGLPHCVPSSLQNFYNDLDISTGMQGGQNLIDVDNIPVKKFLQSACVATGPSAAQTTVCASTGCCPIPNAVCCGTDSCCPPNFPVCDIQNGRCLKSTETCGSMETKCTGGCCNIPNAVCCGGGNSCCPPNFPLCDPDSNRKFCNPYPTPLLTGKCNLFEYTQCADGCCPYADGVCCGGSVKVPDPSGTGKLIDVFGCCPSEYPICDIEHGMCRKPGLS